MCTSTVVPTGARDGESFQLFGTNSKGKFVPLTCVIPQLPPRVVFLDSRSKRRPIPVDSLNPFAKPAIEVELWSGHYDAIVYYQIYPQGFTENKQTGLIHFDRIPVVINPKYPAQLRNKWRKEGYAVSLHTHPTSSTSAVQNIPVKPTSKIRFLYASYSHGWWLYVSIDGQKGYVSDSDCRNLGLEDTDASPVELGDDY
jgi:hypothetical protein